MRRFILVGSSVLGSGALVMLIYTIYLGRYELAAVNAVSLAMNIVIFTIANTALSLKGPSRW